MTVEELLEQNIPNRISQLENMYSRESAALNAAENHLMDIQEIEGSLLKRMALIEDFIKSIAELSYKGGFYEPDKSEEQKIIANLKNAIECKDKRIAEFENTFKQLIGKK
jgi:hypothetical protein